jgi:hypothetical protein
MENPTMTEQIEFWIVRKGEDVQRSCPPEVAGAVVSSEHPNNHTCIFCSGGPKAGATIGLRWVPGAPIYTARICVNCARHSDKTLVDMAHQKMFPDNAPWRTHRNGYPRVNGYLERLARHRGAKLGYRLHRTRHRKGPNNAGQYMLIHKASSTVLLGAGFTATPEMILAFLERPENHHSPMRAGAGVQELASIPSLRKVGDSWWTNGLPREPWDLERFAYRHARKFGYRVRRSRKQKDAKGFRLIDTASNTVLLGSDYSATIESVLEFLERKSLQ